MVHGDTQELQPRYKTKETNTKVLVTKGSGTEGRDVLQRTVEDRERCDPGGPDIP